MEDYPDFTQPWNHGDMIFTVEGRKLYASKAILCMWSPVMEAMFSHNFKERDATEVELPGKDYEEMNELMRVVHPPMKPVDDSNVYTILPLLQEYQFVQILERAEEFLLSKPSSVHLLVLAQRYQLQKLLAECLKYADGVTVSKLKQQEDFGEIDQNILNHILMRKVQHYETIGVEVKKFLKSVVVVNDPKMNPYDSCYTVDEESQTVRHRQGSMRTCPRCTQYIQEHVERFCAAL